MKSREDSCLNRSISFSAPLVPEVGEHKAPGSKVAGHANVLIFPNLDAANIGYKMVQRFANATALGPLVQGLAEPILDLSRGCSSEDVADVVAVCCSDAITADIYKKEMAAGRSPQDMQDGEKEPIHVEGIHNILFIALIVLGVVANGVLPKEFAFFADGAGIPVYDEIVFPYATLVEIVLLLLAAYLSLKTTKQSIRAINEFSYAPIAEVAKLFIGIFIR